MNNQQMIDLPECSIKNVCKNLLCNYESTICFSGGRQDLSKHLSAVFNYLKKNLQKPIKLLLLYSYRNILFADPVAETIMVLLTDLTIVENNLV